MSEEAVTAETVEGLAAKLETLDLTSNEAKLLGAILDRAADADADVEGYGVVYEIEVKVKNGQPMGNRDDSQRWLGPVARATGLGPDKLGVWTDMRPLS